jgi:hypothetical protein
MLCHCLCSLAATGVCYFFGLSSSSSSPSSSTVSGLGGPGLCFFFGGCFAAALARLRKRSSERGLLCSGVVALRRLRTLLLDGVVG